MADNDKTEADPSASRPTPRDQGAGVAEEATAQRPVPAPRMLTRNERETLRSRLQKKFH